MAEIVDCPPTPLLILTGWLPRLDTSAPVAGPKRYRRSTLYQRVGDPGWGVYDDTDPAQVAALRLRFVSWARDFRRWRWGVLLGVDERSRALSPKHQQLHLVSRAFVRHYRTASSLIGADVIGGNLTDALCNSRAEKIVAINNCHKAIRSEVWLLRAKSRPIALSRRSSQQNSQESVLEFPLGQ